MNCIWISLFCQFINLWSARIAKSDGTGYFIKCFTCRIIPGPANDLILSIVFDYYQMRMSTRHHQTDKRRLQLFIFNIISRNMTFNMMNAH